MYSEIITVADPKGVHGSPAGKCLLAVMSMDAVITVETDYGTARGSSLIRFPTWGVLGLKIRCGEKITLSATGSDAELAISAVKSILTGPTPRFEDPFDWFGTKAPRTAEKVR